MSTPAPEDVGGAQTLPDEVRRFVLTSVPSVPFLEALLLMRSEADQVWDARSVADRLYIPRTQARGLLIDLTDSGFAQRSAGGWRYGPADTVVRSLVDALALAYATRLMEVTALIHSRADKRALQFADAFRWK